MSDELTAKKVQEGSLITIWKEDELKAAHKHSSKHRAEIEASNLMGCFYCKGVFTTNFEHSDPPEWTDKGQTLLCPRCGIDSIIGDASGYPITIEFLSAMEHQWFGQWRDANGRRVAPQVAFPIPDRLAGGGGGDDET